MASWFRRNKPATVPAVESPAPRAAPTDTGTDVPPSVEPEPAAPGKPGAASLPAAAAGGGRSGVDVRRQSRHVLQIPVASIEVKPISHDELGRNVEADIANVHR